MGAAVTTAASSVTKRLLSLRWLRHAVNHVQPRAPVPRCPTTPPRTPPTACSRRPPRPSPTRASTRPPPATSPPGPGCPPPASTCTSPPRRSCSTSSAARATRSRATCCVAAADGAPSPTEALRAIMGRFATWHAEHFRVARIVQYEFANLTPEHRDAVLALRKQIDAVVRDVVTAGVASGEFTVDDIPDTTLGPDVDGGGRRPLVRPGDQAHPRSHRRGVRRPRPAASCRAGGVPGRVAGRRAGDVGGRNLESEAHRPYLPL